MVNSVLSSGNIILRDENKGYLKVDVKGYFVIPVRFYFMHFLKGNLIFKMPVEQMRVDSKVTTRFCAEMLEDFVQLRAGGFANVYVLPEFLLFYTKDRKWYHLDTNNIRGIRFQVGNTRVLSDVYRGVPYSDNNACLFHDAQDEYNWNLHYERLARNGLPLRLHSYAPNFGEHNVL